MGVERQPGGTEKCSGPGVGEWGLPPINDPDIFRASVLGKGAPLTLFSLHSGIFQVKKSVSLPPCWFQERDVATRAGDGWVGQDKR